MATIRGTAVLTFLIVAAGVPAAAQEVTVGGQVRPRFEFRDRATRGLSGEGDAFVSTRVRGEIDALLEEQVRVFLQIQDVRLWGEEGSTLSDFSADGLDLHQGYVDIRASGSVDFLGRIGRQEIVFGGQRLIGNVNWAQQARAFDAARINFGSEAVQANVFGALLSDATAPGIEEDAYLLGAYSELRRIGPGTLDLYGFFNSEPGELETSQLTVGARWWGESGKLRFRGEASYQAGVRNGSDARAFMVGGRVGTTFAGAKGTATLWYDYLSGGDDPLDDRVRVFDTLFATNHKHYGLADLFLNIPVDTDGRGLQDFALKGSYAPAPKLELAAELHSFHLARSGGLSTGHLGEEIDLIATYRYSDNLRFQTGLSVVFAAAGLAEIGRLEDDMVWTYAMMDVRF